MSNNVFKKLIFIILITFNLLYIFSISKKDLLYNRSLLYRDENIESISEISKLYTKEEILKIKNVSFFTCKINNMDGIENFENLESIIIGNSQINQIPNLSNVKKLKAIDFGGNIISKIENLNLNLEEINLIDNKIEKINGLEKMINLKTLILSKNQIKEIEGIKNLTNLEFLNLSRNNITKLKELDNLKLLKELWISNNKIEKIEGLDNLKNLEFLELSGNNITKVENLTKLVNLKQISLNGNPIKEITKIDYNFLEKNGLFTYKYPYNAIFIDEGVKDGKIKIVNESGTTKSEIKKFIPKISVLRFRELPSLSGKYIRMLNQGEKLELLEIGKEATIDCIKGNWVKIRTEKGEEGWCFSGYLEEVK